MRRVLKAGGSLAALLLLPVTAGAHSPVAFGTPNVIHGCRVVLTGVLRQITSGSCLLLIEAVVHWNITGPAGPTGATGPTGAAGPTGATGPAGSPDTPDQVRDKFFTGTSCVGNGVNDEMVKVGATCVDVYEASLWSSLTGGTPVTASLCDPNGNDCAGAIFARSIAGVTPSASITWFQAQQACANVGKRLLTNAEWQQAAAGTPDGAPCIVDSESPGPTGTAGCDSNWGTFDMVGNLDEWVADWVPRVHTLWKLGGLQ